MRNEQGSARRKLFTKTGRFSKFMGMWGTRMIQDRYVTKFTTRPNREPCFFFFFSLMAHLSVNTFSFQGRFFFSKTHVEFCSFASQCCTVTALLVTLQPSLNGENEETKRKREDEGPFLTIGSFAKYTRAPRRLGSVSSKTRERPPVEKCFSKPNCPDRFWDGSRIIKHRHLAAEPQPDVSSLGRKPHSMPGLSLGLSTERIHGGVYRPLYPKKQIDKLKSEFGFEKQQRRAFLDGSVRTFSLAYPVLIFRCRARDVLKHFNAFGSKNDKVLEDQEKKRELFEFT